MAARSIGSGTLSFGLVSIPVKLFTAASSKSVSFHMLHAECGSRLKQQLVCPVCNVVVTRDQTTRGFEHTRDTHVVFSQEELKELESARTNTLELVEFVPADTVDLVSIEKSTYLGPDKGGERAYRLLAEVLEEKDKLAVGIFETRGKDQLVLVRSYKKGLILHEVYYADEVRSFDDVETGGAFEFKPVEKDLAEKLVDQLTVDAFKPEAFKDTWAERVHAAVQKKVEGEEVHVAPEAPKAQIIDLLEALKKSVATGDAGARPANKNRVELPPASERPGPKKAETKPAKKRSAKTG